MQRQLCRLIILFILSIGSAQAQFFISAKMSCAYSLSSYSYLIGPNVMYPDIEISTGPSVMYPDIRIKLVSNPKQANLLFVDDMLLNYSTRNYVDMSVCKTIHSLPGGKSIRVGPNIMYPDIRVRVGPNVSNADYRLYFNSSLFSVNEAAALFPAIWSFNRN